MPSWNHVCAAPAAQFRRIVPAAMRHIPRYYPRLNARSGASVAHLLLSFRFDRGVGWHKGSAVMTTIATSVVSERKPLYQSLFVQVLVALLLGIVLGVEAPDFAVGLKILSDAFLKLISMIVAPIVFCVVVHGIAGAGDLKKVGRVGVKALVYFETMTTVALCVGLLLAYLFGPGHGMNIDTSTLDPKALSSYADNAHKLQGGGIGSFLINIIPTTSFDALARNDVLQVLFFAILFGVSLALVGGET